MLFLFVNTINEIGLRLGLPVYHAFDILRIMLEIIIYSNDVISRAVIKSAQQRLMLAKISREIDAYYLTGIFTIEFFNYFPAFVFAAVIDEYQLYRRGHTFELVNNSFADLFQGLFAVINGDDDRVQWLMHYRVAQILALS
jgi:hypothetical protein